MFERNLQQWSCKVVRQALPACRQLSAPTGHASCTKHQENPRKTPEHSLTSGIAHGLSEVSGLETQYMLLVSIMKVYSYPVQEYLLIRKNLKKKKGGETVQRSRRDLR